VEIGLGGTVRTPNLSLRAVEAACLGDVKTHLDRGITDVTFHSDDSLRYGSASLLADREALLNLFAEGTELIRKLANFEALYVPLFFAPMSLIKLKDRVRFIADNMLKEHWELMLACWDHNFRHLYRLYGLASSEENAFPKALIRSLIVLLRFWIYFMRGEVLRRAAKRNLNKAREAAN
jgi:hypothetical protein